MAINLYSYNSGTSIESIHKPFAEGAAPGEMERRLFLRGLRRANKPNAISRLQKNMLYSIKKCSKNLEDKTKRAYLCIAFRKNTGSTGVKNGGQSSLKRLERRVVQEKERSQFRPGKFEGIEKRKIRYTTKSLILAQDER